MSPTIPTLAQPNVRYGWKGDMSLETACLGNDGTALTDRASGRRPRHDDKLVTRHATHSPNCSMRSYINLEVIGREPMQ